jgi:hypothetical protein
VKRVVSKLIYNTSSLSIFRKFIFSKTKSFYRSLTAQKRALPDFIIAGAAKAGTTSLFRFLGEHPGVMPAFKKEIKFFNLNYSKGLDWYRCFFPIRSSNSFLTCEATPTYFFDNRVPQRINECLPGVKIIILIRDPIKRAISHFHFNQKIKVEKIESFEEFIGKLRNGSHHDLHRYLENGLYFDKVKLWIEVFGPKQMLIIKSEDFQENTRSEMKKIYQFLRIEEIYPESLKPFNVGRYNEIRNKDILKYLDEYFANDNRKLVELLGDKFRYI